MSADYGRVRALNDVNFTVNAGECVAILGANGAGKTTLFRALSGIMVRRSGEIIFRGKNISDLPSHEIVRLGIAHVPEGKHLFAPLSVAENLELGALSVHASGQANEISKARDLVYELFPRFKDSRNQPAGTLSGGEQQMLCIGRAMMSLPKLLLLDEPSAGLAPIVVEQLFSALDILKGLGLTILLAEQNVALGLRYADRGAVLHLGHLAIVASTTELRESPDIARLYLGAD